jgi:penicillin-binding protein 1A
MVRTSLNPTLQLAAERALHDGMMSYDRKLGGWRGPVSHLDAAPAALRSDWASLLGAVSRPPGMLPDWKLGVVIDATGGEARVGWLERSSGAAPGTAPEPRTGALSLSDLGWARPVHNGRLGGSPRRITDVVGPGDVVMIEVAAQQAAAHPQPAKDGRSAEAAPRLERVVLRQIPQVQGALVSLDPTTGRIFAMVGGWSFETSQFNRVTQAIRQPGSSFKPIVYLTALEQGISPSQKFLDAPIVIDQGAAGQWRPNNYEMNFSGPVPLRIALEKSLNLVTVRVAERVGMEAVAQNAIAFHVVDNMPRVLPTALGAVDTTVLRMAGAYASLAEGGREVVPTLIDSVQDRDGHVVWRAPGRDCETCDNAAQPPVLADDRKEIADPQSVFQIVTMMQGVVAHGTGYEARKGMNRPIAGKTGTTQDFNDAWFIGFTPDLVTAVWIGFDTPASLGESETGGKVAAPIWRAYMTTALKDHPVLEFPQPPGVTMARWDTGSGSRTDAFKPDQTPGASGPVGGWTASASSDDVSNANVPAGGVDSGMGGLY